MRRFKTGVNEIFDEEYCRLKNESEILSPHLNERPHAYTKFWDKPTIEGMIKEYVGDAKGLNNDHVMAIIPTITDKLEAVDQKFLKYQNDRENLGFERPTEMLPELKKKQSLLYAKLDVYLEELAKMKQKLEGLQEVEEVEDDKKVLKYGLMCQIKLKKGNIAEIDGQRCGRNAAGLIIICDKRSRFLGMAVGDYRKLSKTWQDTLRAADRKHLLFLQDQALSKGTKPPSYYRSFGGSQGISKDLLPQWPEGTINHLENSMVRTE